MNDPLKKTKICADCGSRKSVSKQDINSLKRKLRKLLEATTVNIFKEAGVPDIAKSTRNRILAMMAETIKCPKKNPLLTTRHKTYRIDWAKYYIKTDMKHALFTIESRSTLDGPDGLSRRWVRTSDQQEADVNREEGESFYGLVLLGMSLLALFVYKKALN